MASHPEFDSTTTATQVAAAFGPQIKGKTGKLYLLVQER